MEEIYCFAGNPLDRVSERRRDADWIASLLDDPETRLLPLHGLKPLVRHASAVALDWQRVAPWRSLIDGRATLKMLGGRHGRAGVAIVASRGEMAADGEWVWIDTGVVTVVVGS